MEIATADVTQAESQKSSDQIEREMEATRDSITEKVAALENQVLGTIQTATDTVTGTVDAVKEAVTTAPAAIRDTFREIVDVVKETAESFSVSGCIRAYPAAAIASSTLAGFLAGVMIGSRRRPELVPQAAVREAPRSELFGGVLDGLGGEVRKLATDTFSKGIAAFKQSIEKRFPAVIESLVERVAGPAR